MFVETTCFRNLGADLHLVRMKTAELALHYSSESGTSF